MKNNFSNHLPTPTNNDDGHFANPNLTHCVQAAEWVQAAAGGDRVRDPWQEAGGGAGPLHGPRVLGGAARAGEVSRKNIYSSTKNISKFLIRSYSRWVMLSGSRYTSCTSRTSSSGARRTSRSCSWRRLTSSTSSAPAPRAPSHRCSSSLIRL